MEHLSLRTRLRNGIGYEAVSDSFRAVRTVIITFDGNTQATKYH